MLSKQNKRYYLKPINGPEFELFQSAANSAGAIFHIWKKGSEDIIKMNFSHMSSSEVVFKTEEQDFGIIKLMVEEVILLKLTYKEEQYFTHGFIQMNEEELTVSFQLSKEILKNIQRQNCRINTSDNVKVFMSINEKDYKCLDISAGGTCFKVAEGYEGLFPKGEVMENTILKFNGREFKIPSFKIAICKEEYNEALDKKEFKIGIQFLDLSYSVEDEIWVLVNKEMRRVMEIEKSLEERKAS